MNYEQKYKEVLSRAKKYWESPRTCIDIDVLTDIFPELKESEDERIRKEIIAVFKGEISYTSEEDVQKYIAWLEKQDEKKSADSYCQKNCKGFQETGKCFADGECDAKRKAEQKPAWSEEDERILYNVIAYIGFAAGQRGVRNDAFKEANHWLKSLKDRVQLQTKQEWDEEDEKKIMWLVRLISTEGFRELDNDKMPCSRSELLDWLKSLKISHWKPSEEQLEALWDIIPHIPNSEKDIDTITELSALYEELKKL